MSHARVINTLGRIPHYNCPLGKDRDLVENGVGQVGLVHSDVYFIGVEFSVVIDFHSSDVAIENRSRPSVVRGSAGGGQIFP